VITLALGIGMTAQEADRFDHEEHEGLFPRCLACHTGIRTGEATAIYPGAESCSRCHDGSLVRRVRWSAPGGRAANLLFDHVDHAAAVEEDPAARASADPVPGAEDGACLQCHGAGAGRPQGEIGRPDGATCLSCHAHEADNHLQSGRECTVCHLPLTRAPDLSEAQIESFSRPPSHEGPEFLLSHAPESPSDQQACATCHARESCTRCHLNADALTAIQDLEPDARVARLSTGREPEYPTPGTHQAADWSRLHASEDGVQGCGNCHGQTSCRTCHRDGELPALDSLPGGPQEGPRGVSLDDGRRWIHSSDFSEFHGVLAAVEQGSCSGCHSQSYCESCHDAADQPVFHWGNYLQTHATEAWGNQSQCTVCHNPDVFCRGCHQNLGLASEDRFDVAYHTSRPLWLLGHGAAARQALESCRSCHAQNDCTRCHSSVGGWRVNPHGPGFDPDRAAAANPASCMPCHTVTRVPG
jgi:hypothetical protein